MSFTLEGVGLHTGARVAARVALAAAGHGLRLRRVDLAGAPEIALDSAAVRSTDRRTAVGSPGGASAETLEHLLAALAAFGWWDALIELDGPELPILDGSALPWVEAIAACSSRPAPREPLRPSRRLELRRGASLAVVAPSERLLYRCRIEFEHPMIGRQEAAWEGDLDHFRSEIAPARTFGFLEELEPLRRRGLIAGGSLERALVFDDRRPLTELRFADEPARHKLLDAIGDLALLGRPLRAEVTLERPGHGLMVEVVRRLEEEEQEGS